MRQMTQRLLVAALAAASIGFVLADGGVTEETVVATLCRADSSILGGRDCRGTQYANRATAMQNLVKKEISLVTLTYGPEKRNLIYEGITSQLEEYRKQNQISPGYDKAVDLSLSIALNAFAQQIH